MDFQKLMAAQMVILTALFDAAQAENRVFTEDEQNKYDAAETEFKRLKSALDKENELKAMKASIPAPIVEKPIEPASNSSAKTQNVQAGGSVAAKKPYADIGDMLMDVAGAKNGVSLSQERLVKAKLNTQTGGDGGFLIPEDFIGSMLKASESESQLFSRANKLTLKGNTANIPQVKETSRADGSRFGGISTYWINEGTSITPSQPEFTNLELKLSKIGSSVAVTEEMLEDSRLLTSFINMAYPAETAFALDQALFDGDGVGKPLGAMNSPALVTVAKEGSQAADTVVYENIVKMYSRMPAKRRAKAAWFINQEVETQLPFMKVDVGTGGSAVYIPAGGASGKPYGTLSGLPVIPIEQAAELGDLGDILLADMSDYIAIVKGGMRVDSSIHVEFLKDQTSFRFIRRVNGAPYTQSALASRAKAAFTTSPYVTLAARA